MAARGGVATFRSHAPSHRMSTNILPCKSANKKYYGKTYTEKNPDAKKHGFDEPKLNTPCALFYMPCQSGFGDSFFLEFVHGKRQFLNPYNVVKQIKSPYRSDTVVKTPEQIQSIQEKLVFIREKFGDEEIERRIEAFMPAIARSPSRCAGCRAAPGGNRAPRAPRLSLR